MSDLDLLLVSSSCPKARDYASPAGESLRFRAQGFELLILAITWIRSTAFAVLVAHEGKPATSFTPATLWGVISRA